MLGTMGRRRAQALALIVSNVRSVMCGLAETYPMVEILNSQKNSEMQLSISASDGSIVPLAYTIIPLVNGSQAFQGQVEISGDMVIADENNYASINVSHAIAYLCCDNLNDSYIQPDMILNALMDNEPQPTAILLYSQEEVCCGISGQNLNYDAFLTMADAEEATQALSITSTSDGTVRATISGNLTEGSSESHTGQKSGSGSSVAMSILYSITGLITILFVIIIATGAIRARRYPERYGPRNEVNGRPRQSRARGLARAVLETIPIVKFGDSNPPKLDPNVELENAQRPSTADEDAERPTNGSSRHLSTIPESLPGSPAHSAAADVLGIAPDGEANVKGAVSSAAGGGASNQHADASNEEGLGCPICTDEFTVGEDVRVLPCNHKFHPQCIDPWLVNVSGTCPLCRLDLRPDQGEGEDDNTEHGEAPPLGADTEGGGSSHASRRRSRLFELHRLRHATVEERIEALRRYRTEQRQGPSNSNEDETHTRIGLANRLRDRFHIRTRAAQRSSSGQEEGSSSAPATTASRS